MTYHFSYLVVAQRSLKNLSKTRSKPVTTPSVASYSSPEDSSNIQGDGTAERKAYIAFSIEHATKLLSILRQLPENTCREIPDYIYLSVVYSILTLIACHDESPDRASTMLSIAESIRYSKAVLLAPMMGAEYALAQLERRVVDPVPARAEDSTYHAPSDGIYDFGGYGVNDFGMLEFPSLEGLFTDNFPMPF